MWDREDASAAVFEFMRPEESEIVLLTSPISKNPLETIARTGIHCVRRLAHIKSANGADCMWGTRSVLHWESYEKPYMGHPPYIQTLDTMSMTFYRGLQRSAGVFALVATFWGAIVVIILSPTAFSEYVAVIPVITLPLYLLTLKWFDAGLLLLWVTFLVRWICIGWITKLVFFSPIQTYGDTSMLVCIVLLTIGRFRMRSRQ
jgi:hypothetical protein